MKNRTIDFFFDALRNEPHLPPGTQGSFIWRVPVRATVGEPMYTELCASVEGAINKAYPHHQWKILHKDVNGAQVKERNYFQITKEMNKMQPLHWDCAAPWYEDSRGAWGPLSVVLHVNDGVATYVHGEPLSLCDFINRQRDEHKCPPHKIAKFLEEHLDKEEGRKSVDWGLRRRAGQCLGFHAGEQVHAGMGWDGVPDTIMENFPARVVIYFFTVPKMYVNRVAKLSILNPEFPIGLMREGVTPAQVCLCVQKHIFLVLASCVFLIFVDDFLTRCQTIGSFSLNLKALSRRSLPLKWRRPKTCLLLPMLLLLRLLLLRHLRPLTPPCPLNGKRPRPTTTPRPPLPTIPPRVTRRLTRRREKSTMPRRRPRLKTKTRKR